MIPLATTTVTVRRPDASTRSGDPYGADYPQGDGTLPNRQGEIVASSVRAVIAPGGASGTGFGGESEAVTFTLRCDPTDLSYLDTITDESTGQVYEVVWALTTAGVAGLGHTVAGLRTLKGNTP